MNREQALQHKLCPDWLRNASWEGDVEISETYLLVTFRNGTWKNGTWKNGIWEGGTWEGGI